MVANIVGPDGLIVLVVLVVVLLFGGSKLPQLARGLGSASHEFKKGIAEGDAAADETADQANSRSTTEAVIERHDGAHSAG
jgi:sec-independent protein translocase protein TatA